MLSCRPRLTLCMFALLGLSLSAPTASAIHPGPGHLATLGLAVPRVYFVDTTGPNWPVTAAAQKWNESTAVGAYRVSACPSTSYYCLPTVAVNLGTSPCDGSIDGVFLFNVSSAGHWMRDSRFRHRVL